MIDICFALQFFIRYQQQLPQYPLGNPYVAKIDFSLRDSSVERSDRYTKQATALRFLKWF